MGIYCRDQSFATDLGSSGYQDRGNPMWNHQDWIGIGIGIRIGNIVLFITQFIQLWFGMMDCSLIIDGKKRKMWETRDLS
jgi:hypothetical protein